jgi:hypothetical protein
MSQSPLSSAPKQQARWPLNWWSDGLFVTPSNSVRVRVRVRLSNKRHISSGTRTMARARLRVPVWAHDACQDRPCSGRTLTSALVHRRRPNKLYVRRMYARSHHRKSKRTREPTPLRAGRKRGEAALPGSGSTLTACLPACPPACLHTAQHCSSRVGRRAWPAGRLRYADIHRK